MLRMFARMHAAQVQTRRPRSVPADQVSGGGSDGADVPQVRQLVGDPGDGTAAVARVEEVVGSLTP